jgi:hypothetical protein
LLYSGSTPPTHVILLMRIYGGTISASDRNVLSILCLYGAEKLTPTGRRESWPG